MITSHKQAIAALAAKHNLPDKSVDQIINTVFVGKSGLRRLPFGTAARLKNLGLIAPEPKWYNKAKTIKDTIKK
jgi:hypothetical protein